MSTKSLIVATAVQQAVLQQVLLQEIASGFWKNARPADHADSWKGITISVGANLGPQGGFEVPRNYNFVNPDFFSKVKTRLMDAALAVEPNITEKQLKKQLINLNQILGGRLTEVGGSVTKLPRGRKQADPTEAAVSTTKTTKVRKVAANIVDSAEVKSETEVTSTAE